MTTDELSAHVYALEISGYTHVPAQVPMQQLAALRTCCDRAVNSVDAAIAEGVSLPHIVANRFYKASRCLYCWDASAMQLLEHETVHALASKLMNGHTLWDMSALYAMPVPEHVTASTTSWHRDFEGLGFGAGYASHLWFFFCLDDVTADNGATWIVPGSHKRSINPEPSRAALWSSDSLDGFPSRVQLCAKAGDLLILNPTLLHTSGRNNTTQPRRLLNLGLCNAELSPLLDHWAIAAPRLQETASPRLRKLLGANRKRLETSWAVLPPGWENHSQKQEA